LGGLIRSIIFELKSIPPAVAGRERLKKQTMDFESIFLIDFMLNERMEKNCGFVTYC
jgi:hypothetical protein